MNRKLVLFDDLISVLYDQESASLLLPDISLGTQSERMIEVSLDHTQVSSSSTIEQSCSECPQGYLTSGNLASHHDLEKKISPAFRSSDYKLVSNIFIGLMMAQYILIFFAIPFSEVDNRPAASVLLCLLGYLLFLLCVLMIPAGLINVPTQLSFQSLLISCVLKGLDLTANIYSVVLCLRVKEPMIEYTFDLDRFPVRPLDITVYIQIVSCLLLVLSIVSLFFATLVFVFNFAYFQAKKHHDIEFNNERKIEDMITV